MYDAVDAMLHARDDVAVVLDEHGHVLGQLSWSTLIRRTHPDTTHPGPDALTPAHAIGAHR